MIIYFFLSYFRKMDNLLIENLLFSAVLYGSLRLKQK